MFCRLDFTATVRADIPLVTQWISYLVKGQWRFAKINHSCFSHSTPVEKKSLPSSGVAERERLGSCQFDTVSKQFSLWQCVKWVTDAHRVSIMSVCLALLTLGSPRWRTMLIKWHVGCHEPQHSKWCPYECWQAQWDGFIQHDNKPLHVLLLWHLSIVLL